MKKRHSMVSEKRTVKVEPWMNIPWLLRRRVDNDPGRTLIERQLSPGEWTPVSASDYLDDVDSIALGLIGLGLEPGNAFAIFGATSYEWNLVDLAALSAGLVVVPIYESDSDEQIRWILDNSDVRAVLTDTDAQRSRVQGVRAPSLEHVLSLESNAIETIREAGTHVDQCVVVERREALTMETLATVVYTSGTTGRPKGVELTHGNFVDVCLNVVPFVGAPFNEKGARTLFFLPMAHVMARCIFYYVVTADHTIAGHAPNINNLVADLQSFQPTTMLVVPRVLEKVYNAAEAKAGSGLKRKIFRWSTAVAAKSSQARVRGPIRRAKFAVANRLVLSKIRSALGGKCHFIVSAGAPLGGRLGHFFEGLGVRIIECYGLTETAGPVTVNRGVKSKLGTVGFAVPTSSIKIADDGELLVRGPHVFRGYQNDPEATLAAFTDDGWFRAGDTGTIDSQGFVTITGRIKELIVTAGGKNVSPSSLEDPLRGHPLISQVVVVGDQRHFIAALITLDKGMLKGWLSSKGLPEMTVEEAAEHPDVLASLDRAIERTNKNVSRAESIRKFKVLTTDFTTDNDLLTPSMKVKREKVLEQFSAEIDELYRDTRSEEEKS